MGWAGVRLSPASQPADNLGMTLLSEPVTGGRHRAPEGADAELRLADAAAMERPGRHAEPAWARELFDPAVDEDPFDWLGFTARMS